MEQATKEGTEVTGLRPATDERPKEPAQVGNQGTDEEARRGEAAGLLLDFARAVDPLDFCCFIFILAHGNAAKAARALGMARRTFYLRLESWAGQGPAYQRMLALVRCRKAGLYKETRPLSRALQSGEPEETAENPERMVTDLQDLAVGDGSDRDYPALLRDMHGALQAMQPTNWATVRDELVGLLEDEVPSSFLHTAQHGGSDWKSNG